MKRLVLLAGIALPLHAHAQMAVIDAANLTQAYQQVLQAVNTLNQLKQEYTVLMQQYEAIAHLPDQVTSMASSLTTSPTLQNPLPQVGTLTGIVSGTSLGSSGSLITQTMGVNRLFTPNGTDAGAQEMNRRSQSTAGIQAMAQLGLQSIEQRQASLSEFLGKIGSSPDVQQSSAIQARLQLEQNYIAGQQAQATQLATLQRAQDQVSQQRTEERQRQDAESYYNRTQALSGSP